MCTSVIVHSKHYILEYQHVLCNANMGRCQYDPSAYYSTLTSSDTYCTVTYYNI